ncbi:MAG TPA: CAP domain-containing protein [Kofleriaceae bacterium]
MRWLVLSVTTLIGCSSTMAADDQAPIDAAGGTGGEPAELAGITAAHNRVRAMTDTATALVPLVWDDALAATAAAWVAQCKDADGNGLVDHNDGRSAGHPYYVGENTYASSGTATGPGAVGAWAGELAHYHYDTNACDSGQDCGHYTQIVWRTTTALGCALATCRGLAYPSSIVCDYGPGGNVNNAKPY